MFDPLPSLWYFSFGWHLDELHVSWAHLEKKRTRLRTNTMTLEDLCSQSLEMASPSTPDAVTLHLRLAEEWHEQNDFRADPKRMNIAKKNAQNRAKKKTKAIKDLSRLLKDAMTLRYKDKQNEAIEPEVDPEQDQRTILAYQITESNFDFEKEIRLIENLLYDNSSPRPPEELNAEIANTIVESIPSSPIPV
nr:RNA-binding protein 39 isoform X1 [Tanacetum cinerariifolium]